MKNFEQFDQLPLTVELDVSGNIKKFEDTSLIVDEERAMRFELLSAYLDGETTAEERRQVQHWLDTDPKLQKLYTQLLRVQQNLRQIPVPTEHQFTEQLAEQVFQKIERRKHKKLVMVGGVLLTVMLFGCISQLLLGRNSQMSQIAHQSINMSENESEPLIIALNQPIVEIPVAEDLPK